VSVASSYRVGAFFDSTTSSVLYRERKARPGRSLVVGFHGYNGDALQWGPGTVQFPVVRKLVDEGYDVFMFDCLNSWGNDSAVARFDAAMAWLRANFTAAPRVALLGYSMGFANAVAVAAARSYVNAVVGVAPVVDLQYMHDHGYAASVDAAFGGNFALNGAAFGPNKVKNKLTVPVRLLHGTSDTVITPSAVKAFATSDLSVVANEVAGDHNTLWSSVNVDLITQFLSSRPWS
jgi:pimeloyl-ACP methyl ester carboxylesterase